MQRWTLCLFTTCQPKRTIVNNQMHEAAFTSVTMKVRIECSAIYLCQRWTY